MGSLTASVYNSPYLCPHFVAGLGGFRYSDLDTPMLLAEDPFVGGYVQHAGVYNLSGVERGLGVEKK